MNVSKKGVLAFVGGVAVSVVGALVADWVRDYRRKNKAVKNG